VYGEVLGDAPYVALFLSMSIIVVWYLILLSLGRSIGFRLNFLNKDFSIVDRLLSNILIWLWLLIVISWLIGVLIGIINGIDPSFVFRNFFGLVVYAIFPFMLIISPSLRSLIIMIFLAGIVQMCYGFERIYFLLTNPTALHIGLSISDMRLIYNAGFIVIFPLLMVSMAYQLLPKYYFSNNYGIFVTRLSKSLIFTLLSVISLLVPAMSKGYILTTAFLIIFIMFISILYAIEAGRIHKNIMILLIFLVFTLYMLPNSFYELIINSYSIEEASNSIRFEQFEYLVSDLTFLGNGLGASLSSGYVRDSSGYGFELTYLNIVHKLGMFSVFLFLSYLITLLVAFSRISKKIYVYESFFVIGLMGYLVVGAGNPLLLSPCAVVLHCIAMYILVKPFIRPLEEKYQRTR